MRILGISPLHDSSVAIVNDGVLEYFCKEERLSRVKRDSYPVLAIEEALKHWPGDWEYKSHKNNLHEANLLHLHIDKAYHQLGWKPKWNFWKY